MSIPICKACGQPIPVLCQYCKKPIPNPRRSDNPDRTQKYCLPAHRLADYRKRKSHQGGPLPREADKSDPSDPPAEG